MTDYKNTLNLPKTDFPMKANLAEQEPERLKKWENEKVYDKIQNARIGCEKFILHDGPPYANGNIHIGTALNKILKDFVIKIKTGMGYQSPYIPGWDCHGLPIELKVDQELGEKKKNMTTAQIRKVCRNYAGKYIDMQRSDFKRLGVLGVWDKPYITMDFEYEAATLEELYKCYKKGEVYKGSKPVYWCYSCETALAEAEVEYADHTSTSIFVKFPIDDKGKEKLGVSGKLSAVIWTTTPWTLPANTAIAVHRDYDYSVIKVEKTDNCNLQPDEHIIIAKDMVENIADTLNMKQYLEVKSVKGKDLEYINAIHPFYDRNSVITLADYVTLEAGTGLVHTAPGHGPDDYETGLRYNLEIISPVDDKGVLRNIGIFDGISIDKANKDIVAYMYENGSLLASSEMSHSYPHCWRCKHPVIFRATPQWFISMKANGLREKTLDAIKNKVKWIPAWGQNRIQSMVENRPDWCISRQRIWGVPIAFI
ncbi:MAG: class I tRNA ligase family protein, partial [Mucispirillum sp.]|nr:class I tRNA ligase family protein [Mucispirillum sp.]